MSNQPFGKCERCSTVGFWNCKKHKGHKLKNTYEAERFRLRLALIRLLRHADIGSKLDTTWERDVQFARDALAGRKPEKLKINRMRCNKTVNYPRPHQCRLLAVYGKWLCARHLEK